MTGFAGMKVIMLTARAQDRDVDVGFSLGADDYITKPFSPQELRVPHRCPPGQAVIALVAALALLQVLAIALTALVLVARRIVMSTGSGGVLRCSTATARRCSSWSRATVRCPGSCAASTGPTSARRWAS